MFFDILAMICAGAGTAGVYLLFRRILKQQMPKWALPAVIGAGMLGFSIWNEYSWFSRVTAVLPDEVEIILVPADTSPMRPWTYLFPPSTRFMALDRTVMQVSAENPSFRQAELMFVTRWQPTRRVPLAFDCDGGRHADLADGAVLAPDGTLTGSDWITAAPGDIMQSAACNAQPNGSTG
jgi:hypothetical protein